MTEQLDIDQIRREYPSQWVLLVDYETDEHSQVIRGRVAAHCENRVEFHRVDKRLTSKTRRTCSLEIGRASCRGRV